MALLLQITQKLAQGFGSFWTRWPRKVAKLEAEKAWKQVVTPEDEPLIHAALDWQVPVFEQRDPERVPHAATWLRGRRWEDEQPAPPKPKTAPPTLTRHSVVEPFTGQTYGNAAEIRKRIAEDWGQK